MLPGNAPTYVRRCPRISLSIVYAAEAEAHELAIGCARDALAERRFADAGRTDEAPRMGPSAIWIELAYRQIFQNATLHFLRDHSDPHRGSAAAHVDINALGTES